jgi:hypothetical protein
MLHSGFSSLAYQSTSTFPAPGRPAGTWRRLRHRLGRTCITFAAIRLLLPLCRRCYCNGGNHMFYNSIG